MIRRRLSVAPAPEDLDEARVRAGTVAVIDVLRATSTLAQAFSAGAAEAVPAATPAEAHRLRAALPGGDALLCGERGRVRIPGFDLGNSPLEYTRARVEGRRLILATTNGSRTLLRTASAPLVVLAAFVNAGRAAERLLAADREVLLVCSGDGGRPCPEDTLLAGCLAERILDRDPETKLEAGARSALALWERCGGEVEPFLRATEGGRELLNLGLEADVSFCAAVDRLDALPECRPGTATVFAGRPVAGDHPRSQASR